MPDESLLEASDMWGGAEYEQIAQRFAPIHDGLVARLGPRPNERWLDVATGTGEVAVRAAGAGADVVGLDIAPRLLEQARSKSAEIEWVEGDAEALPFADRSFDVVCSNFGVIFAPDHANVAAELARVSCPGARLGFTAWKPNPRLAELYRRFTEAPIEGREMYEWGREDHVEDMLGEDFELEFEDGTLWLEADTAEDIWVLFSESAPPVIALLRQLDDARRQEFHRAFVELYESYATKDGGVRAPRRYLLVLGRRK
jgi:SAM-dependent methyltransferase